MSLSFRTRFTAVFSTLSFVACVDAGDRADAESVDGANTTQGVEAGFTSACDLIGSVALVKYLQPDVPVDHVELRSERRDSSRWDVEILASAGVPCSKANDTVGCAKRLSEARTLPEHCSWQSCNTHYYVTTRGDEVSIAGEPSELRALIGRVDHPAEAFAVATILGRYPGTCVPEVVPQFRTTAAGFELVLAAQECSDAGEQLTFRAKVRVDGDGSVHELSRVEVARKRLDRVCVDIASTQR